MGWFTSKKAPDKEPIDWNQLANNVEDGEKATRDIANMTRAELRKLVQLRGLPPGNYTDAEIADMLSRDD